MSIFNAWSFIISRKKQKNIPQPYPSIPGKTEQSHPNLPPRPAGHLHIFSIDPAVVSLPEVKNQALRGAEEIPAMREEAYRHQDLLQLDMHKPMEDLPWGSETRLET